MSEKQKKVGVFLSLAQHEKLKIAAAKAGVPMTQYIEQLIAEALKRKAA